jgi:hypothetical protein
MEVVGSGRNRDYEEKIKGKGADGGALVCDARSRNERTALTGMNDVTNIRATKT